MRTSTQFLFASASFGAVYLIGLVLSMEFWQAGIHFKELLDDKPLPAITELLVSNSWLANFILSVPWFILLGFPLIAPAEGSRFRSPASFVVRYLAFLSIELFFAFVLVQGILMPYLTYYAVLMSPEEAWMDQVPAVVLVLALAILSGAILRAWLRHKRKGSDRQNDK